MNQNDYKRAVDGVRFDPDFEEKTARLLHEAAAQAKEKETRTMKKSMKRTLLVAAILVALAASASAILLLTQPKDVAAKAGDMSLSEAFQSPDAVIVNAHTESDGYLLSLQGIVSGKNLSDYCDADESRSYAVVSAALKEGKIESADQVNLTFSPLISGYAPWQVNGFTLGGGYQSFVHEGVYYAIFDCADLEIFADHTVYLAVYEGFVPDRSMFALGEGGAISFAPGQEGPHALFTLPLDEAKADPAAAKALLDATGMVSDQSAEVPETVPSEGNGLDVQIAPE